MFDFDGVSTPETIETSAILDSIYPDLRVVVRSATPKAIGGKPAIDVFEDGTPASMANCAALLSSLLGALRRQCVVLHYGTLSEYRTLVGKLESVKAKLNLKLAYHRSGGEYKPLNKLGASLKAGDGVICGLLQASDYGALSEGLASTISTYSDLPYSDIQVVAILDKEPCKLLSMLIQDTSDDANFFRIYDKRTQQRDPVIRSYIPQLMSTSYVAPNCLRREWETTMLGHMFRNTKLQAIYLASANELNIILDYLGLYLTMHPFGKTQVLAMPVLEKRGEMVSSLLEEIGRASCRERV